MTEKLQLRGYQSDCLDWSIDQFARKNKKGVLLDLDCGLGKTVISLSAMQILKVVGISPWLVVAPLRVAKLVWPDEIESWSDYSDLKYSIVHGTKKKREAALEKDADVYIINYEGLPWLHSTGWRKARGLVLDESTYVKSWKAKRTKALKSMLPDFKKRILLSATPMANCRSELFAQAFFMDDGETLGKTIGSFRRKYMMPGGYLGRGWIMRPDASKEVDARMAPSVYRLDAESNLDMPELIDNKVSIELPANLKKDYDQLEQEMFLELESGDPLLAESGGSKYSACRQFSSGAIYHTDEDTGEKSVVHLHDEKINTLKELDEAIPTPILVLYHFRHSRERIERAFPDCEVIAGGVKTEDVRGIIQRWQAGETKMLAAQIKAVGHGVDGLQKGEGGHDIVLFDQTDSGDLDTQSIGRIYRSGQDSNYVRIHRLVCKDTVDEMIYRSIKSKLKGQAAFDAAMKEYRESKAYSGSAK